jgi:hypothetical protein
MAKAKEKPYEGYRTYDAGGLKQIHPKANQNRPPNFRSHDGQLYLVRCFACADGDRGRENHCTMVARGECAWCGWKEDKK